MSTDEYRHVTNRLKLKEEKNFRCPKCKGRVFKKIEKGERVLGEDPKKNYERYDCHNCRLFWDREDALSASCEVKK